MSVMRVRLLAVVMVSLISCSLIGALQAQEHPPTEPRRAEARQAQVMPLPPMAVTKHSIKVIGDGVSGDSTYEFTAKVGMLSIKDASGAVQAEVGFVSYTLDGWVTQKNGKEERQKIPSANQRPITVAMNGGPGAASAYLNLMAIGPWRLPMDAQCAGEKACEQAGGKTLSPSDPIALVDNSESWLPFTDLVFIDPPGTGYSRVVGGEEVRKRFYSVAGDIDILAAAVARWIRENDRLASPKFFVGESYGGFRGPLLAEKLQTRQGIGFSGLVLISPVLDFNWVFQSDYAAWAQAGLLPSLAAANLELQGKPFDAAARKDVEEYATGPFLSDMMRGLQDDKAVARVSEKMTALTGLDPVLVRRMAGRIDMRTFQRERLRDSQQVLSAYDTVVRAPDPDPTGSFSRFDDPLLSGMTAPLTSAMVDLLRNRLGYKADDFQYQLLNSEVNRAWDWGRGRSTAPDSLTNLSRALALDPNMWVRVIHGETDLVTPYFTNRLLLNQLPAMGGRVQLLTLPGGHMFYSRDKSRAEMFARMRCQYPMTPGPRDRTATFCFSGGTRF